jgi:hypothetical protein
LEATQVQEELQDLRKSSEEASEGAEMDPLARMRKVGKTVVANVTLFIFDPIITAVAQLL